MKLRTLRRESRESDDFRRESCVKLKTFRSESREIEDLIGKSCEIEDF